MDDHLVPDVYREIARYIDDADTWFAYSECSKLMHQFVRSELIHFEHKLTRQMGCLLWLMEIAHGKKEYLQFANLCTEFTDYVLTQRKYFERNPKFVRSFMDYFAYAPNPDEDADEQVTVCIERLREAFG